MKILHSSFFRALCSIIIGMLVEFYRHETLMWITILVGIVFFLSGIVSIAGFISERRNFNKILNTESDNENIEISKPTFPLVGIGSILFGIVLTLMPATFTSSLMYVLAAVLVLGVITQFVGLASVRKMGRMSFLFWLAPCLLLIISMLIIFYPTEDKELPLRILGWASIIYGIVEIVNSIKIHSMKKRWAKKLATEEARQETEAIAIEENRKEALPDIESTDSIDVQTSSDADPAE